MGGERNGRGAARDLGPCWAGIINEYCREGLGMRSKALIAAVFVAVLAMPAIAQNPPASPPTRIRGTVEKLDGQALTVKSREGQQVAVTLAPNVTIAHLVEKNLADVKACGVLASSSTQENDGRD